ncbi:hypothetical protein CPB97_005296, partial [Podila verticillata]
MKKLFNVLLLSTLAIGSFVTALGDQQAPLPAELNPAQPVMPVMAAGIEAEGCCGSRQWKCDDRVRYACEAGEYECNKKCESANYPCKDKCKDAKG